MSSPGPVVSRQGGSQTLARGLSALLAIVEAPEGLTVNELAKLLEVHRSIAYRLVQTLMDFGLVTQSSDKSYRPGSGLAALADSYLPTLRGTAQPFMRELADEVGCTVSLFVADGDGAVAVATSEPTTVAHHIRFRPGMRTPIDRGAAGYALLATFPPSEDDPEAVVRAREDGYAVSHGEIETGAHAVAAGFHLPGLRGCVSVLTYREEQAWAARDQIRVCAARIETALRETNHSDVAGRLG